MTELPEPLTPPECDLRDFAFMPLDVARLMDSSLFARSTGEEFKAAVALWCKSWCQVPAGSLPDDPRDLAYLSATGARWTKVKAMALHGWIKCSDGRLYHPVVAEKANEAWTKKQIQRERSKRGNEARWRKSGVVNEPQGGVPEEEEQQADLVLAPSHKDKKDVPKGSPEQSLKDRKGQGQGQGEYIPPSPPSEAQPPRTGTRLPVDWQPDDEAAAFATSLGLDPPAVAARFRDYWHAKPGKDGRKLDWAGTWRNWCRRDAEQRPPRSHVQQDGGKLGWIIASMKRDAEDGDTAQRRLIQ